MIFTHLRWLPVQIMPCTTGIFCQEVFDDILVSWMSYVRMVSNAIIFILLLGAQKIWCQDCNDVYTRFLCMEKETCRDCMEANPCCHWCYQEGYNYKRCNIKTELADCKPKFIQLNSSNNVTVTKDQDIANEAITSIEEITQVKPQGFRINLKKGIPMNISFTYKALKDYPLDLYYLGDLSVSMKDNLEVFRTIGETLAKKLNNLTRRYRLAYGSFLDKTAMPFYLTAAKSFKDPCLGVLDNCETGYLFRHRLNFTDSTEDFVQKVTMSKITANIDDLDGALDAIMQILLCKHEIGWNDISRKIILLATDSLLHTAGDGLLAGAVSKPPDICQLDGNGNHMAPLKYDYPSIGHIHRLLREKKVQIIFAVKDPKKMEYYKKLTKELFKDYAFVGELDSNSQNIIGLIEKGFDNFARMVNFNINTTYAEHIDVKFFGDCLNSNIFNETSYCYNVKGQEMSFKVQLTLKEYPKENDRMELYIENNVNDRIVLDIGYAGKCECGNYNNKSDCRNGDFECGTCICHEGWTGDKCDKDCDDSHNFKCKSESNGTYSFICSRHGECDCGKCRCDEPFYGTYCQYRCPTSRRGQICSEKGTCYKSRCICFPGYTGDDCSCSLSQSDCKISSDDAEICSGNGKCECNTCECNHGFSGKYCEMDKYNNTICERYKEKVESYVVNGTKSDDCEIRLKRNLNAKDDESICKTVVFRDNQRCDITYTYPYTFQSSLDSKTQIIDCKESCISPASFPSNPLLILFTVITTLAAGIIAIVTWKVRDELRARADYKKFNLEQKNLNQSNPLYRNPVTTYSNPMRN